MGMPGPDNQRLAPVKPRAGGACAKPYNQMPKGKTMSYDEMMEKWLEAGSR